MEISPWPLPLTGNQLQLIDHDFYSASSTWITISNTIHPKPKRRIKISETIFCCFCKMKESFDTFLATTQVGECQVQFPTSISAFALRSSKPQTLQFYSRIDSYFLSTTLRLRFQAIILKRFLKKNQIFSRILLSKFFKTGFT